MKLLKKVRSKVFVVLALLGIMIADLNPFFVNAGRENLAYSHGAYLPVMFDNLHNNYHSYAISTIGGNQAYCIDYGIMAPLEYSSLSYIKTVRSNKLVSVISNGYPNRTVAQLGANSVEAAYLGTQMAVWQTVNGTGYTKGIGFDINKIQPAAGYVDLVENAKQVAANILAKNTYNPSISVTGGEVDYNSYVEMYKVGPFKVNVTDYACTTFDATLSNAPKGLYIVDKDNRVRKTFNKDEEVYVLVDKKLDPATVTLNVKMLANEKVGVIYGARGNALQNYVFLDFEQKEIEASTTFKWEKQEGTVEVIKVDQNEVHVAGAEFTLTDKTGKEVAREKTNAEGKITFKNVPVGTYIAEETAAPEGYIMSFEKQEIKVEAGKVTVIKAVNEKIIGGLEILKIDEETKEAIEGVTFEIYNSEKVQIGKITTGKDGKAVYTEDNMQNGTYYYKEVSAPDGYIIDNSMKEFKITDENKVAKVTVTNKMIRGKLEITKLDDSRLAIKDVKFNILASDKKTVIAELVTDERGYAEIDKLAKGTYYYQEVEVPDGYIKDEEIFEFKINNQGEVVKREVINQKIVGELEITKLDDTRVGIKGVKFNILASDKKTVIETLTTDKTGYAKTKKLAKGTYYYQEVEVPDGYIKDEEIFEFQINELNEVVKREVINNRVKGNLEILKVDETTNEPIEGVKFNILDSNKKVITTVITDKDGKAEVKDLYYGEYYYQEIDAPVIYKFTNKKVKFEIKNNAETVKITVTNHKIQGRLKITKLDDTRIVVEGAKFNILAEDKETVVDTLITNESGIAVTKMLAKGTYYYQEIEAPAGYVKDEEIHKFEIKNDNEVINRNVINEKIRGKLEITKFDDTRLGIKDVKFNILASDKKTVIATLVTDERGYAEIDKLAKGTYYYQEVEVPAGYIKDEEIFEFEINENNEVVKREVINYRVKGMLKIVKIDADTKEPIENVKFNILDKEGNIVETITTNKEGIATSKELYYGEYYYQEIEAPEEYVVNGEKVKFNIETENEVIEKEVTNTKVSGKLEITKLDDTRLGIKDVKFNILASDKKTVIATLVTDERGYAEIDKLAKGTYYYQEVEVPAGYIKDEEIFEFEINENNEVVKREVINCRVKGMLKIVKIDADTKEPIENVKFNILDKEGNIVETITTNKEGIATSKELYYGEYYYQEIEAPEGYVVNGEKVKFNIETENEVIEKEVTNTKVSGKLEITKLDDTRLGIKDVKFNILASDKKTVIATLVTDERGYAEIDKLAKGTYYYQEVEVPAGYIKDEEIFEFEINENNEVVKREVINCRVKGMLKIVKIDADTKEPIENVKFNILDKEGNIVETITTNKEGIATSKVLYYGEYYYQEIEAPEGYVVNGEKVKFNIESENEVIEKEVTNTKVSGKLEITKLDDTRLGIKDVKFNILASDKKTVIATLVTDERGYAEIDKLAKGTYYYQEVEVPAGYIKDEEIFEFEINENNEVVKREVINYRVKGTLKIFKVDENNTPIKGVEFEVLDSNHNKITKVTTNENGFAEVKDLLPGTYYYKEVKVSDTYVIDFNEYEFDITLDQLNVEKKVVNELAKGTLRIVKLDKETKAPIEGVTFEVLNSEKQVIETIVTNKDGIAESKALVLGKYYYKEISAPDKYIVENKIKSFRLENNGEIFETTVYNSSKSLPVTGGMLSLDMLIMLIVAGLSVSGYTTIKLISAKKENN